jgi:hypothetical protein
LVKAGGDVLEVGLGRPVEWIAAHDARPGGRVWLDLPEMGAVGDAVVVSVEPCPDPGPKPHPDCRLVTGTFRHASADIVDVHVAGLEEPIGTTSNHRFWSEDRQAFIEAGELRPGENLRTAAGTLRQVARITPRPGTEAVYNLEVDVEHVYYVSAGGVLVHNAYHKMLFEHRRGGKVVIRGRVRSGGTHPGRRLTFPEQRLVHSERKLLRFIRLTRRLFRGSRGF